MVERAAPLGDVPPQSAHQANVVVRIHEDANVHLIAEFVALQDQDALDDNELRRPHGDGLREPHGLFVTVDGLLDLATVLQRPDVLAEQIVVEGGGMVEVDLSAVLDREVAEVVVVGILVEVRHPISAHARDDFSRDGGLSGSGAARDAEGHNRHGLGVSFGSGSN